MTEHKIKFLKNFVSPASAILGAFLVGSVFIIAIGKNPFYIYGILFSRTLGSSYGFGQVLFKATPLILAALGIAFAFHGGLFNIGANGQIYIGAFACAWAGFTFSRFPGFVLFPVVVLASVLGGGFWGWIAGVLKARRGAHEVITTIMLNFIALALCNWLVSAKYHVPETVHTASVPPSVWLPRFSDISQSFAGSAVNLSFFIALICAVLIWWVLYKSPVGYAIRAQGFNPEAAKTYGIKAPRVSILTMTAAGALSGLVGTNFILGYKHYFEQGFAGGTGFMAIAVALLGRNHPFGIVLAGILFGILDFGGLAINAYVPKELVEILQAIIIIFVIVGESCFDGIVKNLMKKEKAGEKTNG
ncbi:MAG: ABC transporter permease [Elusimicrobia bacterium]|nr:ABC transporter permease [Elusimicrobiota bacterium]